MKIWRLFPAVTAFSVGHRFLVSVLRVLLWVVQLFYGKKRSAPPQLFTDDALHYSFGDIVYFAYKYYLRPPILDDAQGATIDFFKTHPPIFSDRPILREKKIVTITAAGDLMPYVWIQKKFCTHLWDDIAADFFSSDITFANLETPIDLNEPPNLVPEVMLNDMLFNADEEMFSIFNAGSSETKFGFDILSTANNHALDKGESGVAATIDFLRNKKIRHTGTARNAEEKFNFPVIERNGIRIAFIAYTYSMNKLLNPPDKSWLVNHIDINQPDADVSPIRTLVAYARHNRNADLVVLSLHFSNAYQAYPCAHILENVKNIFSRCGTDVIIGNHAHHIQPPARIDFICPFTQKQKSGFVNFACGDFVAYDIFNWGHLAVYLRLHIAKGRNAHNETETFLEKVDFHPVYICGTYRNENDRDLRLLDAGRLEKQIQNKNIPSFFTAHHLKEFHALKKFYAMFVSQHRYHADSVFSSQIADK